MNAANAARKADGNGDGKVESMLNYGEKRDEDEDYSDSDDSTFMAGGSDEEDEGDSDKDSEDHTSMQLVERPDERRGAGGEPMVRPCCL